MLIDIHAHYVSPKLVDYISQGNFAPELQVKKSGDSKSIAFPAHTTRPLFQKMTETEKRISHMQELSIDMEVLSTWVDLYGYELNNEIAKKYHTKINETLSETVKDHPREFKFVATVPLPWGADAALVLEHAIDKLGAIGSMIGTNIDGANLDDPRLEPFWQASENLSSPVILHPLSVAGRERLGSYYLENLLGNPFDTAIAASSLIFGGVLDKHPNLQVVLLHGGGLLTPDIGRLDHGYEVRPEAKKSAKPPSKYLDRFFYDTIVYDERLLDSLVRLVGSQLIVLGTDYPFDMEPRNPVRMIESVTGSNTRSILEDNTRKLFRNRL